MEHKQKDWFGPQCFYLGIDVGRPFLRAVGLKPGGTIAISRRQDRWCAKRIDVGYLPGKAIKYAWEMFPGTAKNDRTDAEAIAQAGIGIRTATRPIAETDELSACV